VFFFSLGHFTFGSSRRAWPSVASFHRVLRWSSSGADYLADAGGGILSLDFVPQGRAFAFVGDFLCHDDECFGFGDVADVDCSVSAACEQHQPFSEQLTMWPNNSPEPPPIVDSVPHSRLTVFAARLSFCR